MKKIITGIFALALAGAMSLPSFAVTNDGMAGTGIKVNGTHTASADPDTVISADVIWDDLTFVYQDGDKSWDASAHQEVAAEGAWEATQKAITVKNHSNVAIKATLSFATDVEGLTGNFDKTVLELPTAEGTERNNAPAGSAMFGVSGSKITEDRKIGTVTVSIADGSLGSN